MRWAAAGRDDGAVAILVAIFAVALFGFAALVVDTGHASDIRGQSQHAADAAALAGAQSLAANTVSTPDQLATLVEQYVGENSAVPASDWSSCTDAAALTTLADQAHPGDSCISYNESTGADGGATFDVRVKLPKQHVPTTFGGIFGVGSIAVSPIAQAEAGLPPPSPCQPCDPRIGTDGQPVAPPALPVGVTMPDSAGLPPGSLDPVTGCPTGPGAYTAAVAGAIPPPSGSSDPPTIVSTDCVLPPGLYVFDDVTFKVRSSLSSDLGMPRHGVTLVFRHAARFDVEGTLKLSATPANTGASAQGEIPGIVLMLGDSTSRTFELGPAFSLNGSLYALDGARWHTDPNDCVAATCRLDDGVLAVAGTDFGGSRSTNVPAVASDTPAPPPAPQPPHLVR